MSHHSFMSSKFPAKHMSESIDTIIILSIGIVVEGILLHQKKKVEDSSSSPTHWLCVAAALLLSLLEEVTC